MPDRKSRTKMWTWNLGHPIWLKIFLSLWCLSVVTAFLIKYLDMCRRSTLLANTGRSTLSMKLVKVKQFLRNSAPYFMRSCKSTGSTSGWMNLSREKCSQKYEKALRNLTCDGINFEDLGINFTLPVDGPLVCQQRAKGKASELCSWILGYSLQVQHKLFVPR